ncbi:MAG TPA: cytidine deaminase [Chloroflexota bacterium]
MSANETDDLIDRAIVVAAEALHRAYVPYSHFRVGAAVATADGLIFAGANVENASYGLTVCAERIALWSATVTGATDFPLIVIVTDTAQPVAPCGACRQVLFELAPDAVVVMSTLGGVRRVTTVPELLPGAFGKGDLSL